MKLKDKVVLITGGGSGLGREMGLTFAREGAKVGINDIRPESAQNVTTEIERAGGKGAKSFVADVSNSMAVKKMFTDFLAAYGTIDILDQQCWHRTHPRERRDRGRHADLSTKIGTRCCRRISTRHFFALAKLSKR